MALGYVHMPFLSDDLVLHLVVNRQHTLKIAPYLILSSQGATPRFNGPTAYLGAGHLSPPSNLSPLRWTWYYLCSPTCSRREAKGNPDYLTTSEPHPSYSPPKLLAISFIVILLLLTASGVGMID